MGGPDDPTKTIDDLIVLPEADAEGDDLDVDSASDVDDSTRQWGKAITGEYDMPRVGKLRVDGRDDEVPGKKRESQSVASIQVETTASGLETDTLKIQKLARSEICEDCGVGGYLDVYNRSVYLPETVNMIWYDAEQVQNQRLDEKQKRINSISASFVRFIMEFVEDWGSLSSEQYIAVQRAGEQLFRLRKQKPADGVLIKEVKSICEDLLEDDVVVRLDDNTNFRENGNYTALRRDVWINGTAAYILLENKRHETMQNAQLLYWFKPTLAAKKAELKKQDKYRQVDDIKLQVAAEEQIFAGLNEQFKNIPEGEEDEFGLHGQDVLTAVIEEIFDGMPEIYQNDLKTNSITELQNLWCMEDGLTVDSWRIKHFAYIKLMIIYSLMKILGTIDFMRKAGVKKWLEYFIKLQNPEFEVHVDIKSISRAVGKDILNLLGGKKRELYLAEGREPHPFDIQDIIRCRIEIVIPEKVLKTGNPEEIKLYVQPVLGEIFRIFQTTSYDRERLRNSMIGQEINEISGNDHKAFQITLFKMIDVKFRKKMEQLIEGEDMSLEELGKFIKLIGEVFRIEAQATAAMDEDPEVAEQKRVEDDKKYAGIKLSNLRNLLGVNVEFSHYINDLADIFIQKYDNAFIEEEKGGIVQICGRERLAHQFLVLFTTEDPKTKKELTKLLKDPVKGRTTRDKFHQAASEIATYMEKKQNSFVRTQINCIKSVVVDELINYDHPIDLMGDLKSVAALCDLILGKISDAPIELVLPMITALKEEIESLGGIYPQLKNDICARVQAFFTLASKYVLLRKEFKVNGFTLKELCKEAQFSIDQMFFSTPPQEC